MLAFPWVFQSTTWSTTDALLLVKAIRNSRSGIPGNWGSLSSQSGIPGNFKSFWFFKNFCAKFWQNTAKFASFASVICITKTLPYYYSYSHCTVVVMSYVMSVYWCLIFIARWHAILI